MESAIFEIIPDLIRISKKTVRIWRNGSILVRIEPDTVQSVELGKTDMAKKYPDVIYIYHGLNVEQIKIESLTRINISKTINLITVDQADAIE